MSNDERFEQVLAFLGSQLPAPVDQQETGDGSIVFTSGAPPEVVVHLEDSSVVVFEYAVVWESSGRMAPKPRRLGSVKWRRLPETAMMNALTALIKGAREVRLARYRECTICGRKHPPESLLSDDICTWCAERPRTVVH